VNPRRRRRQKRKAPRLAGTGRWKPFATTTVITHAPRVNSRQELNAVVLQCLVALREFAELYEGGKR
jgi:hypothetical protein